MPFSIVRQDLTKMNVDAIVNAANTNLQMGGGVCGAIFNAAGAEKLQKACNAVAPIKIGGAVITPGFSLNAKYVIHAVGPIYSHWSAEQNEIYLQSAYRESLELAEKKRCRSIAFPLISSGIYGYPKDMALSVATKAIKAFLENSDMDVYIAVFDMESFQISTDIIGAVESYVDENFVNTHNIRSEHEYSKKIEILNPSEIVENDAVMHIPMQSNIDDYLKDMDEPFSDTLLRLIDEKGKTDVEVYKKANIDRKLFSKIRKGKGYMPSKRTILAMSVALELTLAETDDLLKRGGYALSHVQKFDVIVEYFIVNGKYDIFEINEVLFKYDQPLLGV